MAFFDDLETRSSDQRLTENAALLKDILNLAANFEGYKAAFGSIDLSIFKSWKIKAAKRSFIAVEISSQIKDIFE